MRLAAAGILPPDPAAVPRAVAHLRALGLQGASWHLRQVGAYSRDELLDAKARLEDAGIVLAQVLPPQYESLVHPEVDRRRAGLEVLARCGELAALLGADNLYVRPGSLNPRGPWLPHRDNHRPEVRERLVGSLREAGRRAEGQGIVLTVEGHVVSPLHTPEVTREVLDGAASPAVRFNLDLVNYAATLDDAYDPSCLEARLFRELGTFIQAAHLKDVCVEESLVVHISETVPGRGNVDFARHVRLLEEACPGGWAIVEHLAAADVPEALAVIRAALALEER